MRLLEIRRHAQTKKGAARGHGSHLSQGGVDLASRIGRRLPPFDFVVASLVPRTVETAVAMGFSVDVAWDMDGDALARSREELPRHAQWEWDQPFRRYAEYIGRRGAVAELAEWQHELWRRALEQVPDEGRALIISHGGHIEAGLVGCLPDADHATWGGPFRHCEGALLSHDGRSFTGVTLRRNH